MRTRTSWFAVILIATAGAWFASPAAADTIIAGGNILNQTWNPAGSPYIVQGDITVPAGSTLTIEPGTAVHAVTGDSQASGLNMSRVEITVAGTLDVNGTAASPVTFRGVSAVSGAWYGIIAASGAASVTLDHARITQAIDGISTAAAGSAFAARNVVVDAASVRGIVASAGAPLFDAVTTIGAGNYGFDIGGTASPTVRNSISRNNALSGINWTSTGNLTVQNSTFNANASVGIYAGSSSGPVTVVNSIVTNNNNYGLFASSFGTISVSYSDIWNNTSGQHNGNVATGAGILDTNPLFVSPTDLRLTSNSPARFATMASADLGALPFDGAATPGLYGTLWSNTTLTTAAGPHQVAGDLTVAAGVSLTIEPGATLQFQPSDIMAAGIHRSRGELQVRGTLIADGTPAARITLTSTNAVAGSWYGIDALPGATHLTLDHVTINRSIDGLTWRAATSGHTISHLTVDAPSVRGVVASAGAPLFDAVITIGAGNYGFDLGGTASPTVRNSISRNNALSGINWTSTGNLTVQNSTFNANASVGIYAGSSSGPVTVVNSIVTNNNNYGLFSSSFGTISVSYSDIWNNASGQHNGNVATGAGILDTNPLFASPTDLRLTSNSPARFATMASADLGALPFDGAATPGLYGTLWSNTTLTTAAGPHQVAGDLTVAAGVILTIEPGATLQFQPSDIMAAGIHRSRGELQVRGTLIADGTPAARITLSSTNAVAGSWYGIDALPGATHLTLDHVTINRSIDGLTWRAATSGHTISHLTVDAPSVRGVVASAGAPLFDAVTTIGAGNYGFDLGGTASPTVRNSISRNNALSGINWTSTGNLTVQNSTFNANASVGIYAGSSSGPVTVVNSIVTNNNNYGLFSSSFGTISVSYSDIWNNASGQHNGNVATGAGILNANPQFVSSTDLHLLGSSVAIDAGTAGPLIDADGVVRPQNGNGIGGSEWDLGAYEFVLVAMCGNGAVEPGEVCDSGAANGSYGACNAGCTGLGPRCGDGAPNGPEQCDDGNTVNTDACLNTCLDPTCGDGFIRTSTEECDDGNLVNTDACVGACQNAECGDGYVRTGSEQCDDGNLVNNDACSNACVTSSCGDGVVQAGEECDDGNGVDSDACRNACLSARCGDGVIRAGSEQCDDGNTISTDACTATCQDAVCGDGITRTGTEECDDANAVDTDACVMGCIAARCGDGHVRGGFEGCDDGNLVNSDACTNACVSSTCGDGVVQAGVETCDDANLVDTDACRNNCGLAMCGDGVVQTGVEACDDSNTTDGDGCSASCEIETGGPDAGAGGPDAGGNPGDGDGGGCCSTSTGGATRTTSLLASLAILLTLRRRRRRDRPTTTPDAAA